MSGERLLCGVLPDSIMRTGNILESSYDVTFVTTLEQARHALASAKFDLIICGVHFDDGQMPLLLQHCKADLRLKEVPFIGFRVRGGRLSETTYVHISEMTNLLGGVYVDLVPWIDTRGQVRALSDFKGMIATLLRNITSTN